MRRLFISALALLTAIATLGTGTLAWFHDEAMSRESTFTAGTLTLEIRDSGEADPDPWGESVDLTWVMKNMAPGESEASNTITLRNTGSVKADHVEMKFTHAIDEASNPVESDTNPTSRWQDLAKWIQITDMVYAGIPLRTRCTGVAGWDVNGNGWLDLEDIASSPIAAEGGPLDNLSPPDKVGGEATLGMTVSFRSEATSDIQGDILTTTLDFTLNQHSSQ